MLLQCVDYQIVARLLWSYFPKNGKIEQIFQIYKAKLIKEVQDKRVTI